VNTAIRRKKEEKDTLRIKNKQAKLLSYNIHSKDIMMK